MKSNLDQTIHLSLTNDDLKNAISSLIKDVDNKENIVDLMTGVFAESHVGCNYLFKFLLGGEPPKYPVIGSIGYINLDDIGYGPNKADYIDLAVQGYVKVIVTRIKPIHNYSPIVVALPAIGDDAPLESHVSLNSFYPEEDFIEL